MRARGFTLVEVMVALAVVAVALPALLLALDQQIDNTGYLREKSLAKMVAANELSRFRLVTAARKQLGRGKDEGVVEMMERDWYWRSEVETTEVPNFFRVEINVAQEEGDKVDPLYTLVAFMSGDFVEDVGGIPGTGNGGNGGQNGGANGGGNGDRGTPPRGNNGGLPGGLPENIEDLVPDG